MRQRLLVLVAGLVSATCSASFAWAGHPHGGGGGAPHMHMPSPPRMPQYHMPSPPKMPQYRMPSPPKMPKAHSATPHATKTPAHAAMPKPHATTPHTAAKPTHSAGAGHAASPGSLKTAQATAFTPKHTIHPSATAAALAPIQQPGALTHPRFYRRYWGYNHHYYGYRRGFYGRRYYNRGLYGNQMAMRWLWRLRRDLNAVRRHAPNPMYAQRITRDLNGVIHSRYSRPSQGQLAQLASDSTMALAGRGRSGLNSMSLARHFMTVVNRGYYHPNALQSAIMGSRAILLRAGIAPGPAGTVVGDLSAIASGNGMLGNPLGMLR